jgi:hypothetical protein
MISTATRIAIFFIDVSVQVSIELFVHPSIGGGSRHSLSQFCEYQGQYYQTNENKHQIAGTT